MKILIKLDASEKTESKKVAEHYHLIITIVPELKSYG